MPYRADETGVREKLFNFCKEYYESEGYEVRTFDSGHEIFNRSASRNMAVDSSSEETTILIDADTIIPIYAIQESLELLSIDDCVIKPTNRSYYFKDIDNSLIDKIKKYESLDHLFHSGKTYDLHPGAAWIFNNNTFYQMGKFCEQFEEYGFEDLEFTYRSASIRAVMFLEYDAYSFLHPISMNMSPEEILNKGRSIYESTKLIFNKDPQIVIYSNGRYFGSPKEYTDKLFEGSSYSVL